MSGASKSGCSVSELDSEIYAYFKPEQSWEERCKLTGTVALNKCFCLTICEPDKSADLIAYYRYQMREPKDILPIRSLLKDVIVKHTTDDLSISDPAFSGRSGNDSLFRAQLPRLGNGVVLWATKRRLWDKCIGESMNNPFYYLLTRQLNYVNSQGEPFVPAIAAFDVGKMRAAPGNPIDKTSWQAKEGLTIQDALAALYFFSPKDFRLR